MKSTQSDVRDTSATKSGWQCGLKSGTYRIGRRCSPRPKQPRDAARLARLQQKRKERYGEHLERLAGGEGRKHRMKQYGQQAKEGRPCFDCGVAYPNYVMDFDHVRGTKDRDVSACTTLAMLKREIAKCDLVCANCHRERTFRRRTDLLPT
jgi:hypothetical protein